MSNLFGEGLSSRVDRRMDASAAVARAAFQQQLDTEAANREFRERMIPIREDAARRQEGWYRERTAPFIGQAEAFAHLLTSRGAEPPVRLIDGALYDLGSNRDRRRAGKSLVSAWIVCATTWTGEAAKPLREIPVGHGETMPADSSVHGIRGLAIGKTGTIWRFGASTRHELGLRNLDTSFGNLPFSTFSDIKRYTPTPDEIVNPPGLPVVSDEYDMTTAPTWAWGQINPLDVRHMLSDPDDNPLLRAWAQRLEDIAVNILTPQQR